MTVKARLARLEAVAKAKQAPDDEMWIFLENPNDPERTREAYERLKLTRRGPSIFFDGPSALL